MTDDERLRSYDKLANDPEFREPFLRLVKKKYPKSSIPEIDAKDAIETKIDAGLKAKQEELDKLKDQLLTAQAQNLRDSKMSKFKGAPYWLRDEEIEAVEKLMVDEQIPNFDTAVRYYRGVIEPLTPSGYGIAGGPRAPKGRDYKSLIKDMNSDLMKSAINGRGDNRKAKLWAKKESDAAFDELRSGQVQL